VIFDFDGTLADSKAWFFDVLGDIARRYRFRNPSREEIEELRGHGSREIMRRLGIPMWKLPFIARHTRRLAARSTHGFSLFPGISAALVRLHGSGLRIALATSNTEGTVRRILGDSCAATIDHWECSISMFGKASRIRRIVRLSGIDASRTILIGDETRDVEAAHQAGVAAGVVLWGYGGRNAFEKLAPEAMFASVEEMADFLAG
jgi:phosphoglycolate phosphatase